MIADGKYKLNEFGLFSGLQEGCLVRRWFHTWRWSIHRRRKKKRKERVECEIFLGTKLEMPRGGAYVGLALRKEGSAGALLT